MISPVGIELGSRVRCWSVERVMAWPLMVGEVGFRLK